MHSLSSHCLRIVSIAMDIIIWEVNNAKIRHEVITVKWRDVEHFLSSGEAWYAI